MLSKFRTLLKTIKLILKETIWTLSNKFSKFLNGYTSRKLIIWDNKFPNFKSYIELIAFLEKNCIVFYQGNHTIYIPPQKKIKPYLKNSIDIYPDDCGFKILKDFGNPQDVSYFGNQKTNSIRLKLRNQIIGKSVDQVKVANYMNYLGIGPRIYDIASLKNKSTNITFFAVQDVKRKTPSIKDCKKFLIELEKILNKTVLKLVVSDWKRKGDFKCPSCNNNLFVEKSRNKNIFRYVDFQNFFLNPNDGWTKQIIKKGHKDLSFGNKRLWRGSLYLYQSINNSTFGAKRNTDKRWSIIKNALKKNDYKFENRLILDIGCNAGMIIQKSLSEGAFWAYGWDLPNVSKVAEELLFSIGETRFNIIKTKLNKKTNLQKSLQKKHKKFLKNSVVFYLAIRHHVGVIESLSDLNCKFFIYEGQQGETLEKSKFHLNIFLKNKMTIFHEQYITDGDSDDRPLLILISNQKT